MFVVYDDAALLKGSKFEIFFRLRVQLKEFIEFMRDLPPADDPWLRRAEARGGFFEAEARRSQGCDPW